MFNFKDQYNKVSQKQCSNSVKNLRKELPKQSPFRYGSKKISFNVKNRSEYWDDIEKVYTNEQERINSIIGNVLQNLMNGKDTDYDIADSVMYSPVSPVLAVTLVMLNKALFQCKTFSDYMESDEAQVYAYTHWNGKNFVTNPTALVIDNPFGNETEKYKKILPGYSKISVMNFYKGYQVYVTDYSSNSPVSSTTAAVSNNSKYWGSYHIDTKRFQRVFATKPDLDRVESGSIVSNVTFKDSEGMEVETLNMHPELDSYLYADGIFKKLMDSPYNSQSYQISVLRGGYGFGPINIACFLKAKEFDIERITDIISGLLIAEDSGMPLIDAIRGIQEWRISVHDTDIDTIFDSLSDIRILRYIEYIGSIFFTAILGSSLKEKPLINIPLTSAERKIYDVGYLMGHNYDIFVQMFKNGIKNKIWLKDSTEIFSFEVPCVLYGTEPTTGIFKIGDYVKNYSDSLLLGSEPLDYAFGVSSILEKEKALTDYIIPQKGYTIFDFITKGLNKSLILNLIKNIHELEGDTTTKIMSKTGYVAMNNLKEVYKIYDNVPIDFNIAPRDKDNNIDPNFSNYLFNSESTVGYIVSPAKLNRISIGNNDFGKRVIVGEIRRIVLYDKAKNYKIKTKLLYVNRSGDKENYLVTDIDYYITNSNDNKVFSVIDSTIDTTQNTYEYINNTENLLTTKVSGLFGSNIKVPVKCILVDIYSKEMYNFEIFYDKDHDPSANVLYTISSISDVPKVNVGSVEAYNSLFLTIPSLTYNGLRTHYINGVNVLENIFVLFNQCGFNPIFYRNEEENNKYHLYQNYLNKLGLCIMKLSTINAFCTSYSLDLLSLPDTTRQFYDIYKSYLSDFIDIKQEIQN